MRIDGAFFRVYFSGISVKGLDRDLTFFKAFYGRRMSGMGSLSIYTRK